MISQFLQGLWQRLTQAEAERDFGFQQEIRQRSWQGLQVVGWALVLVPLAMTSVLRLMFPEFPPKVVSTALALCIMATGSFLLAAKRGAWLYDHSRTLALLAICVTCFCLTLNSLLRATQLEMFLYLINGQIAVALLIGLLSVPFRPVQVLLIGTLSNAFFLVSYHLAVAWALVPEVSGVDINILFLSMVTVLTTGVSVSLYRQTYESYQSHRTQLQASDDLRDTQCRVLLADSAAAMGRLAAALSHELNNPLGVLKSNLDTMRELTADHKDLPPEKSAQIANMKAQLCRHSEASVERMQQTVRRMQRFSNLDRAEVMPVDINQLLRDVSELVKDALDGRTHFELELQPEPDVEARPQMLSAVFSALLQNAAEANPGKETVRVTSALVGKDVRVEISDHGRGMSKQEMLAAMEPTFRLKGERVAACNWNLFGARQIVREHGGEIEINSEPGQGTRVVVNLPAQRALG